MLDIYDHEVPIVESDTLLEFSGEFSRAASAPQKPNA